MKIRARLRLVSMAVSGSAIVFACGTFILVSVHTRRSGVIEDLQGLARVTARNCEVAVDFGIPEDAIETLSALQVRPSIVLAQIYDSDGQIFAEYRAPRYQGEPPVTLPDGVSVDSSRHFLRVYEPIETGERALGVILVEDDRSALRQEIMRDLTVFGGVMWGALAIAFLLANRLERRVSGPVLALTNAARAVSERQDYEIRVPTQEDDEFAVLARALNDMLATIQARDAKVQVEITERRRAEQRLREHRDNLERLVEYRTARLKRSNKELEEFAYVASHDLQEPLRKISAFGSLLMEECGPAVSTDGREYLEHILGAVTRMQALINDLLQLSRVATHANPFVPVDLNATLREVLADLDAALKESGGTVTVEPLPVLDADAVQMRQLFQNLIANALKFRKPGEAPIVRVKALEIDENANRAVIAVEDRGIGFEPRFAERIFGLFQRLHGRLEYKGTGIGLAVCRRIVERHGGRITAEGRPGDGATFRVELPIKHANQNEEDPS